MNNGSGIFLLFFKKITELYFSKPVLIYLASYILLISLYARGNYEKRNYSLLLVLFFFIILVFFSKFALATKNKIKNFIIMITIAIIILIFLYGEVFTFVNDVLIYIKSFKSFSDFIVHFINMIKTSYIFYLLFTFIILQTLLLDHFKKGVYAVILNMILFYVLTRYGLQEENGLITICIFMISMIYAGIHIYSKSFDKISSDGYEIEINNRFIYKFIIPIIITVVFISTPFLNLNNISNLTYDFWEYTFAKNAEKLDINLSGFGTNKKLGGKIIPNNEIAMLVECEKPMYLRGSVRYIYTGKRWLTNEDFENNLNDEKDNRFLRSKSIETKSMSILPVNIKTNNYFSPLYAANIISENESVEKNLNGIFYNKNNTLVKDKYQVSYYDLSDEDYKKLRNDSLADVKAIDSLYLNLPQDMSKKVMDLSNEITAESNNDEEKVSAVVNYLMANYKYETDVGNVEDEEEFVENFLFNQKEGYCTYFASAAAVLIRFQNIPVRYTEGFLMRELKDTEGRYAVTNAMAHAWIEVIDKETGLWKIVDPTPAGAAEQWFYKQLIPYSIAGKINFSTIKKDYTVEEINEINKINKKKKKTIVLPAFKEIIKVVVIIFLVFCVFLTILLLFFIVRCFYVINCIKKSKSIIPLYKFVIKRLRLLNINFSENLTDSENINNIKLKKIKIIMNKLVRRYHDEYFGDIIFEENSNDEIFKKIEDLIKSQSNRFEYYFYLYADSLKIKFKKIKCE